MKAITLTQPWATLVAIGAKKIETRSWSTLYRGRLAIHAAKNFPVWAQELACSNEHIMSALLDARYFVTGDLPHGSVIATCEIVDCVPILKPGYRFLDLGFQSFVLPSEPELSFGDYTPGRFAWILEKVCPFEQLIPAKGSLGLWNWNVPNVE